MRGPIPVVLFTYARPTHLAAVLRCLRENQVPKLHVFADGPKGEEDAGRVAEVHEVLRAIDWCSVHVTNRAHNLGLGANVITGLNEISARYDAFIVWEDDLVCVPGTYAWLSSALTQYAGDPRVMSVTAWTHPRVTPPGVAGPYCDGRAECWAWGAYARSWRGMAEETATDKLASARRRGLSPAAYGHDLPLMAAREREQNIWAVRWLYHHFQHAGLCVRPPWSMVEHIGFDSTATNAAGASTWANPPLRAAPEPGRWPEPHEHPDCRRLWLAANPPTPVWRRAVRRLLGK